MPLLIKDLETGVAMNAISHMAIGLGAKLGLLPLELHDYKNQEGHIYPNISKIPFIILRGKSSEIKKAIHTARDQDIHLSVFTNTMTGSTYKEQLEKTAMASEAELAYYGCFFFGPWDKVHQITKKFSLYR